MAGKSSQHLRSLHSARKTEKNKVVLADYKRSKTTQLTKRRAKEVQFLETICCRIIKLLAEVTEFCLSIMHVNIVHFFLHVSPLPYIKGYLAPLNKVFGF